MRSSGRHDPGGLTWKGEMETAAKKHHRTMNAIVLSPEIMDNASALDWRVLHAIELHQGYKTWRCRLSLGLIAQVARCSRKSAGNSSRWWAEMGVLKITRTGKSNIFEVVQDFQLPPERVHRQRHISRTSQKRGPRGKWAPSTAHQSPPSGPGDSVPRELSDTVHAIACPSCACHPILYGIWVTFYMIQRPCLR